ncbi:mitochondrial carrier protein [Trypanosoma rangeli]|uniref:Mitochondrial carrier protein n=1 Tax=Trypanosoma rangeli TaxID=5698 RepID=A0A422NF39_TRYRA|nr:mitochondrial carrier protein [Trypanosoma rangeli]RNF04084.1 mitochondrial carrier protein [Trypanosoma rangeli]|eukprot:RNF04084.1 mitochondrial carrier protein [Trypanosoma rangeli]
MNSDDAREIYAGSIGGALATVVEYPFDTIKVRLQDDPRRYRSTLSCIAQIARREGPINGFFKGLPAPVIGAAAENAILFCTYRVTVNGIQDIFYSKRFEPDTEPYHVVFSAAAIGGLVVSTILTPAELIKCKMQVQNTLPARRRAFTNSLHCAMSIYSNFGVRGLYKGHVSMLLRETIGCGLYFLTFECVIRNMLREGQGFTEASPLVHFLGGGCAGVAFWTATYPIDALKTKIQTGKGGYGELSLVKGMMRMYKREGMRGCMRGYTITALRAFPGNAVLIAVYEKVSFLWEMSRRSRNTSVCAATCVGST